MLVATVLAALSAYVQFQKDCSLLPSQHGVRGPVCVCVEWICGCAGEVLAVYV